MQMGGVDATTPAWFLCRANLHKNLTYTVASALSVTGWIIMQRFWLFLGQMPDLNPGPLPKPFVALQHEPQISGFLLFWCFVLRLILLFLSNLKETLKFKYYIIYSRHLYCLYWAWSLNFFFEVYSIFLLHYIFDVKSLNFKFDLYSL